MYIFIIICKANKLLQNWAHNWFHDVLFVFCLFCLIRKELLNTLTILITLLLPEQTLMFNHGPHYRWPQTWDLTQPRLWSSALIFNMDYYSKGQTNTVHSETNIRIFLSFLKKQLPSVLKHENTIFTPVASTTLHSIAAQFVTLLWLVSLKPGLKTTRASPEEKKEEKL